MTEDIENKANELEKSFTRSCIEGYQDTKILGKKEENFYALVNRGQMKEWFIWLAEQIVNKSEIRKTDLK